MTTFCLNVVIGIMISAQPLRKAWSYSKSKLWSYSNWLILHQSVNQDQMMAIKGQCQQILNQKSVGENDLRLLTENSEYVVEYYSWAITSGTKDKSNVALIQKMVETSHYALKNFQGELSSEQKQRLEFNLRVFCLTLLPKNCSHPCYVIKKTFGDDLCVLEAEDNYSIFEKDRMKKIAMRISMIIGGWVFTGVILNRFPEVQETISNSVFSFLDTRFFQLLTYPIDLYQQIYNQSLLWLSDTFQINLSPIFTGGKIFLLTVLAPIME